MDNVNPLFQISKRCSFDVLLFLFFLSLAARSSLFFTDRKERHLLNHSGTSNLRERERVGNYEAFVLSVFFERFSESAN